MTIREVLDSLPQEDRDRLNYAFEHGIGQFALLSDGRFIGVNTQNIPFLKSETRVGAWSVGKVADHGPARSTTS